MTQIPASQPDQHAWVPQPAPGPGQPPAPEPRRKGFFARHKVLTAVGVVVLLAIAVSAANGGSDEAPEADTTQGTGSDGASAPEEPEGAEEPAGAEEEAPAELPGVGDTTADGTFEFTVTQVELGVARVGDDMFGQDAQGQFVLVHMRVVNIGDDAQYFDGSSQTLVDTQDRRHSADTGAAIYLGDANSFLNQINPGNQVEGVVVFDVPADAQLASIELHDSPFSGGVTVSLS
jgi:hypothetical protein